MGEEEGWNGHLVTHRHYSPQAQILGITEAHKLREEERKSFSTFLFPKPGNKQPSWTPPSSPVQHHSVHMYSLCLFAPRVPTPGQTTQPVPVPHSRRHPSFQNRDRIVSFQAHRVSNFSTMAGTKRSCSTQPARMPLRAWAPASPLEPRTTPSLMPTRLQPHGGSSGSPRAYLSPRPFHTHYPLFGTRSP